MVSHPGTAMIASLIDGNATLADWLFLIAAILFVVLAVIVNSPRSIPTGRATAIQCVALALVAVGLLVS